MDVLLEYPGEGTASSPPALEPGRPRAWPQGRDCLHPNGRPHRSSMR